MSIQRQLTLLTIMVLCGCGNERPNEDLIAQLQTCPYIYNDQAIADHWKAVKGIDPVEWANYNFRNGDLKFLAMLTSHRIYPGLDQEIYNIYPDRAILLGPWGCTYGDTKLMEAVAAFCIAYNQRMWDLCK